MQPDTTDADARRIRMVCAERRAAEILTALRNAVDGVAHWRVEAKRLMRAIDAGEIPTPAPLPPRHTLEAGQ